MERIFKTDKRLVGIKKERFVVNQIRKWLPQYPMIMISGPRKVGKTTALLQLAADDPDVRYMDCSEEGAFDKLTCFSYGRPARD